MPSSHEREAEAQRSLAAFFDGRMEKAQAFESLYRAYYGAVRRLFGRWVSSPEDREELTQETFVRIYQSIEAFRRDSSFSTFLFKIARNIYLGYRRKLLTGKRNAIEIPLEDRTHSEDGHGGDSLPPTAPLQEADLLSGERRDRIREAVARLPEQRGRCLILLYYRGFTVPEIAATLQLADGTVKAHLFQARQQLKEFLGPEFRADLLTDQAPNRDQKAGKS